jgi:chromate transporter
MVCRNYTYTATFSGCDNRFIACGSQRKGGQKMIYLQLLYSYLKIGFFGFGGGYAMLSLIQNEVVVQNQWMTNAEFTDIVAISQMTPGPIAINSATYIGYTVAGFWGSMIATVAVCLPALTLMILITRFFLLLRDNRYVKGAIAGMKPVVVGMIGAAALLLMFPKTEDGASFIDGWSWALFAIAMIASLKKFNPILLIVAGAIAGVAIYYLPTII